MNHFTVQTALCKSEYERRVDFTVLLPPHEIISMVGKTVQDVCENHAKNYSSM